MYAEIGLNERLIPRQERFDQRMRVKCPTSRSFLNNNTHIQTSRSSLITGGTAISIEGNMILHKSEQGHGADEEGLGRWTWVRVKGKGNTHTRFISAYCPVKNTKGFSSVWNQQVN